MTNLDIETFWAVVHHGTMTAAAESLFITQPTLSMRIRALEERVGTPLFLRGKGQRRITLTAAGQKFLTLAQRWQQLLAETESLAELEQRAYLRIAATYTTNQYILPPVYKRFCPCGCRCPCGYTPCGTRTRRSRCCGMSWISPLSTATRCSTTG